jgi:uncharacterized protein
MPVTLDLLGFLTLGLLGGFGHCVGMCAPFVLFISRRYVRPGSSRRVTLAAQLWYTLGRVLTYMAMGAAAGALGGVVDMAANLLGWQRAASVVAGVALILYGLVSLVDLVPLLSTDGGPIFSRISALMKRRMPGHPLIAGLLLGFLPCGLSYSAVIAATARGGPLSGAVALALFGLGTAPALLGLSFADELLVRHRALINRLSQGFILVMGVWFVWTGLGYG